MAQSLKKCEICDKRECALICIDCDQYFCQECKTGHIKTKTTKDHQFLDSGTFQPQFKKLRCIQHEQHFIFFCERCQTLVCPVCLPDNHQEHRMLKIDEIASMKKNVLNETIKTFVTKLNEFQEEVNSIKNTKEKCQRENKDVIQHVNEQAKHISNVLENQRRCIIASVKRKANTEDERISIIVEDLEHCIKEAKELERKVKLDLHGSDTSILSNFQLSKSKIDTFEFQDTSISTCPVQFAKYNVPKEELSLLESVFSGNLSGWSAHGERNTLKSMMSKHDWNIAELQKELTNQIQISRNFNQEIHSMLNISKSLPEVVATIDKWKTQGVTVTLPCTEKPKINEFIRNIETAYNFIIGLKNNLIQVHNDLEKNVNENANWFNREANEREQEKKMHRIFVHQKDKQLQKCEEELKKKDEEIKALKSYISGKMTTKQYKVLDSLQQSLHASNMMNEENQRTIICIEIQRKQLQDSIEDKDKLIQTLLLQKDTLQSRLSSITGEKLTKGYPEITDLGVPNRPMEISERYGELYDKEWTDAMVKVALIKQHFPDLEQPALEEIIVRHLYRTLMFSYQECKIISLEQTQTIRTTIAKSLNIDSENTEINLPGWKEISFFRKHHGDDFATCLITSQKLCEKILEDWDYSHKSEMFMEELLKTSFFDKCVHLCWYMVIQEPMMYLDDNLQVETKYNKAEYKEYVQSGDKVRYIVWPALYLHEKGPLLYKGVVQAYF